MLVIIALLAFLVPSAARAATAGAFEVTGGAEGTDWEYASPTLTVKTGVPLGIKNTSPASATTDRIVVGSGVTANITLGGANIDVSATNNACAFDMTGATVNLTLAGANTLKSGEGCAGLEVPEGASLTIANPATDTVNSLIAQGGFNGAGIGGAYRGAEGSWNNSGTITINGGNITANGGYNAAGIGGGHLGNGSTTFINGGNVTATGGKYGAGIGGGCWRSGGTITIDGGNVTAIGLVNSTGIGGGLGGSGGIITINGGNVSATGSGGAGIGGGDLNGSGGTITINGGNVTATSSNGGAGIGNGKGGGNGTLAMDGDAVVFASSVSDTSAKTNGILFNGNAGTVYGAVALHGDETIPPGSTLTVPNVSILHIPDGVTLTNNGSIVNNGTIVNVGTITGSGTITGNGTFSQNSMSVTIAPIPGVTVPVAGKTPVTVITATNQYTGTVSWSPAVSGSFDLAVTYTATITLTAKSGFTFADVGADFFTVAGAMATNSAGSGIVTAVFPPTVKATPTVGELDYQLEYATGVTNIYNEYPQPIHHCDVKSSVTGFGAIAEVYYEGTGGTTYAKSTSAPTNAGTYSVSVNITEGTHYTAATGLVLGTHTIGKRTPDITWPTAAAITELQALSDSLLAGGSASVSGAFAWADSTIIPNRTNSGYSVTFTPTDSVNYSTVTEIVSITVNANLDGISYLSVSDTSAISGDNWSYDPNTKIFTITGDVTLVGSTTTNRVVVQAGVTANITLKNVTIDVSATDNACAFLMDGAAVNLVLSGTNTLKSAGYASGLGMLSGSTLTIVNPATDTVNKLTAVGGDSGPGIGPSDYHSLYTTITINGGNITTIGGYHAAGIGGGYSSSGPTITINGGIVTATGGVGAAGIGGGGDYHGGATLAMDGDAVVFASSVSDTSAKTNGILFNGNSGAVYGNVTLQGDVTIPAGKVLFVPSGSILTIPAGVTLTNNGTIFNLGQIIGTIAGNQPLSSFLNGNGSASSPYLISTSVELAVLADYINTGKSPYADAGKYYKLTADLDLSAYSAGEGWVPIGSYADEYQAFKGNFDGDGHIITGLTINAPVSRGIGLFGYVSGGNISNLGVVGVNVTGGNDVGGIVGRLGYWSSAVSTVRNCYVTGTVRGEGGEGGCTGGIAGLCYNSSIEDCYSTGAVRGEWDSVGGIVGGMGESTVRNCYATGEIGGNARFLDVGGIAGSCYNSTIEDCYSTGKITGSSDVGGIVGVMDESTVRNCYATGAVSREGVESDEGGVGGIAGTCWDTITIENCAALNASVTAAGGIVDNVGRVVGYVYPYAAPSTFSNNIAFSGMSVNGATIADGAADNPNGADISAAQLVGDGTIGGLFTNDGNPWTTENGKLPGFGAAVDMPDYLRLTVSFETVAGIVPVAGATAASNTTEAAHYTGTVTWVVSGTGAAHSGAFDYETSYTATITLTPKAGYTLAGVAANTFAVAGATSATHAANSGVITVVFPATAFAPPPVLTAGWANRASDTAATLGFGTDRAGTAYYFVVESGATPPADTAIRAANQSFGAVSAGEVSGLAVTLTAGAWDVYVVVENARGYLSNVLKIAVAAHVHTWETAWSSNATGHWHECTAHDGVKSAVEPHTESGWIIDLPPTATAVGHRHTECVACGYVLANETLPATGTGNGGEGEGGEGGGGDNGGGTGEGGDDNGGGGDGTGTGGEGGDGGDNGGGTGDPNDPNNPGGPSVPLVTSVTLAPSDTIGVPWGESYQFAATVSGTGDYSRAVTWSLAGAESAGTTLDASGLLRIGEWETAETLTVTATSAANPAKSASTTVLVGEDFARHGLDTKGVKLTLPKDFAPLGATKFAKGGKPTYQWYFVPAVGLASRQSAITPNPAVDHPIHKATGKTYTVKPAPKGLGSGYYYVVRHHTKADGESVLDIHPVGIVRLITAPKIGGAGTPVAAGRLRVDVPPQTEIAGNAAALATGKPYSVLVGDTFTLAVDLQHGTGTPIALKYEWFCNGKPAPGVNDRPTYTATMGAKNAKYTVRVSNGIAPQNNPLAKPKPLAKVTSKAFTVRAIVKPGVTISAPKAFVSGGTNPGTGGNTTPGTALTLTVAEGKTVKLTAKATGTAKLAYEWYAPGDFDPATGTLRTGATPRSTTATLSLKTVTTAAAGTYIVRVTNAAGEGHAAYATATLNVTAAPAAAPIAAPAPASASGGLASRQSAVASYGVREFIPAFPEGNLFPDSDENYSDSSSSFDETTINRLQESGDKSPHSINVAAAQCATGFQPVAPQPDSATAPAGKMPVAHLDNGLTLDLSDATSTSGPACLPITYDFLDDLTARVLYTDAHGLPVEILLTFDAPDALTGTYILIPADGEPTSGEFVILAE